MAALGPIVIDWAERDAPLAFDSSPRIVLAAPQLTNGVYTDARLASIAWLPQAGFDLCGPLGPDDTRDASMPAVVTETKIEGVWTVRYFELERGCRYQLRLSPEGRAALLRRGEIRYADMFALLGGGESLSPAAPGYRRIKRLSTAFYTRVFERAGPSFRAAFSEHVSSVDEAAHNQAKWFAGYWGAMATASAISQKEVQGMLLKSVVPKHPEAIMHTPHALQWLEFMCEAADEAIPERESLLREAVLRFALHFLAFFDFAPKSLCEQRAVVDAWVSERQRNAKAAI
jgi:truncated hemoglobin YjbI